MNFMFSNFLRKNKSERQNRQSEQITSNHMLEIADDQVLSVQGQYEALKYYLGEENCSIQNICGRKVFVYSKCDKQYVLLCRSVSYLGNPHPIFKKRVQLPSWYEVFCNEIEKQELLYDVRFLGVYHYKGNIVFIDFKKDTYLRRRIHNSSAHVYTNDIYQALKTGVFKKEDQFGNEIFVVASRYIEDYLLGRKNGSNELFELFVKFNNGFSFGEWLYAVDKIREMYGDGWKHWQQAEWAGWFLEYKFNKFVEENAVSHLMKYVGSSNKSNNSETYDFDIWFPRDEFYGDLKSSDVKNNETPGNDQSHFIECINRYNRFWYVIYEHETKKDSETTNYEATIGRNQFIRSVLPNYKKDDMSYSTRMKNSVCFVKMLILELNNINYRDVLADFNQGRQVSGSERKKKFIIKKKDIDKYVVFRYNYSK